jgi:Family of unknown function (DUF5985)
MIEGFLLGVIVTAMLVAGGYFLKFWRQTRDLLFPGFGAAFIIEGLNRTAFLFVGESAGYHPVIYSVRLLSYLLILASIAHKNRRR